MNTAIIVAGGSGSRMKSEIRKQYLELDGIPVLKRTLAVFTGSDLIDRICLVVPKEDIRFCQESMICDSEKGSIVITAGGSERRESVWNGLICFDDYNDTDIVLIHDGVRPFIDDDDIRTAVNAAREFGAAIPASPAFDTVKLAGEDRVIKETLPREHIWLAQTPQAFRYEVIIAAHRKAAEAGYSGTDDASLVEMNGGNVSIFSGRRSNIKITTPEDLVMAEALLRSGCK